MWTYYLAAEPLEEIRSCARERRQPLDASSLFVAETASAV
jgi:hypothetical protein